MHLIINRYTIAVTDEKLISSIFPKAYDLDLATFTNPSKIIGISQLDISEMLIYSCRGRNTEGE